ncbi:MAG: hypothetical protein K0R65_1207 [Crocinitomicaceae bacterium]|jgi:hypothetical protein|nr:hypothetical protein [Crocinitomicaceae bacterium]
MKSICLTLIVLSLFHAVLSQEIPDNYKGYNDYGSFAEKAGNKWGIKQGDSNSAWIVDPIYDTIVLINSFQYGIPKHRQTEMTKGYALFVLFEKMPVNQTELHKKASGVPFKMCKVNGEPVNATGFDGYELVFSHYMDENYTVFSDLQAMKLYKNGKCTLLEPGFEFYEADYTDFKKQMDYGLWIATKTDGSQALLNGSKEILVEAKKIEPYHDSATYNLSLESYEIGYMQTDIPYLYVTDNAGFKQIYSIAKQQFVTPKISPQGSFMQIAVRPAELEDQLVMIEVEYTDNGLKGYYNSQMGKGLACAFEDYYFLTELLDYVSVAQPGKVNRMLYAASPGKEPKLITEYEMLIHGRVYSEYMDYYADGLLYKLHGKYGVVNLENTTDGKLYDTLYPHETGSWYTFEENGKFGLTDGKTLIPAVFDEPVVFETNRVTAMHGNLWFTQAFTKNGETFYYDSQGKEHVSQGNFAVYMFGKNKYGIVEHKQMNDAEFVTLVEPRYHYMDPVIYGYTFIAKNKKGKTGLIDLYGDTLIPFEYDWIMDFTSASQGLQQNVEGKLFTVSKGKKTALFSTKSGWLTKLDEHTFDFSDNYGIVLQITKKAGDKFVYGINTIDGKVLLEPVFDQSTIQSRSNYFNTMISGQTGFDTYMTVQDNKRDPSKRETTYLRFDFMDDRMAYRLNCNTNKIEQYDLLHLKLVSAMSPVEFARLHKYNLHMEGNEYVLEYHDPMKDEDALEIVRLEAIDFVMIGETLFLVGKKGKVWNKYHVEDDGINQFESFFYKVLVDGRFLRVTSSGTDVVH